MGSLLHTYGFFCFFFFHSPDDIMMMIMGCLLTVTESEDGGVTFLSLSSFRVCMCSLSVIHGSIDGGIKKGKEPTYYYSVSAALS
jgi:hypothetical protein